MGECVLCTFAINRRTTEEQTTNQMATKYPESKLPTQTFILVEQLIRSTFDGIITATTERRDQLLVQLNDMKLEYLDREETRNIQVSDVQKLISQLMEASIKLNSIVKLQEEQIRNLEKERNIYEAPTPVPIPSIRTDGLESLLEQLRGLGTVEDQGSPYRERINPIRQFGKEGDKKGEFRYLSGLALYRNETIYIADTNNHRIQTFSIAGKFLSEFGKGELSLPYSIAFHDKSVFVTDYILNAVFKFQIGNNKFVCQSTKGELNRPSGITVVTSGEVLVADSYNNRIAVFNPDLKLVREVGKDKLEYPCDVKINNNNNNIFVADNNEITNIHIFTQSGDMIRSFIKLANGTAFIHLCFDLNNNIIVSDFDNKSIQIFTMEGELMHRITCESYPKGIAFDNNNNIICACGNVSVCIY